jgi:gluconate kinase
LISERLASRKGHFMPASLRDSQFAALEPPATDEIPITVGIDRPAEESVDQVRGILSSPARSRQYIG